mmetsp:Transcript_71344/g.136079  ORF Transcript_71344/g.136079 Transcript_71344/m.136079 type:complete len:413 (-) Transcript_71344:140-1378(-)
MLLLKAALLQCSATLLQAYAPGGKPTSADDAIYGQSEISGDADSLSLLQLRAAGKQPLEEVDEEIDKDFKQVWGTDQATQWGNDGRRPKWSKEEEADEATASTPKVVLNVMNSNRIIMQIARSCSGSSSIFPLLKGLIKKHGYHVWTPTKEFLNEAGGEQNITGKKYCTLPDGTALKWTKDPVERLQAVFSVFSGTDTCQEDVGKEPTVLFFDGQQEKDILTVLPYLGSLGPKNAQVIGLHRKNRLESRICDVRECLAQTSGEGESLLDYPVRADGSKSDHCHQQRQTAGGTREDHQVYLDSKKIVQVLKGYRPVHESLKAQLIANGFDDFPAVSTEVLTEYKYDDSEEALERSAISFGLVLGGIGIIPNITTITNHLEAHGKGRRSHIEMAKDIYNYKEVKMALKGTSYRV